MPGPLQAELERARHPALTGQGRWVREARRVLSVVTAQLSRVGPRAQARHTASSTGTRLHVQSHKMHCHAAQHGENQGGEGGGHTSTGASQPRRLPAPTWPQQLVSTLSGWHYIVQANKQLAGCYTAKHSHANAWHTAHNGDTGALSRTRESQPATAHCTSRVSRESSPSSC
jgi:hypothetical protein